MNRIVCVLVNVVIAGGLLLPPTPLVAADEEIRPLIQQLESSDVFQRLAAAAKVGQLGPSASDVVPALIEALKCERIEVLFASPQIDASRQQFAEALVKIGTPAEPKLIEALDDPNDLVRVWAAYALFSLDSAEHTDRAMTALMKSFAHGVEVACDAAMVLEQMNVAAAPAVDVLIQQLDHYDITVRCNAAHALSKIAVGGRGAASVRLALEDDSRLTRVGAAYVLYRVDMASREHARGVLSSALRDTSADVRRQATWAIGQMGVAGAPFAGDLIDALGQLEPDPMSYFRGGALGRLGTDPSLVLVATGAESKPALMKALTSDDVRTRVLAAIALQRLDPTSVSRTGPILAAAGKESDSDLQMLASMNYSPQSSVQGPEAGIDELIRLAMTDRGFGPPSPATQLLARRGAAAVEPLIAVLTSGDGIAAGKSGRILAQIGEPAITPLSKLLERDNAQHRFFAVRALAQIGEPALPHLGDAMSDTSYPIRRVARYALLSIGTPQALAAIQRSNGKEQENEE